MFYIRLDDASEYINVCNWDRIERLFDKYNVRPLFGMIPCNKDEQLTVYGVDKSYTKRVERWIEKGWIPALHGYTHCLYPSNGGINPVNKYSEFVGKTKEEQKELLRLGLQSLREFGITPKVFFAPAHTFDSNTLKALKEISEIRIISDTVSNRSYTDGYFTFVPQQSGHVRVLPFKEVTFCYHPNIMSDDDFVSLERFLEKHKIDRFPIQLAERRKSILDRFISFLYFARRKL